MEMFVELFTIILYLTVITIIGLYTARKTRSSTGFFLADRSISWLPLMATITATTVGGSATIVAGGRIFASGLPALWYDLAGALGLIILGIFIAKKIRKTKLFTLPDIIGSLYDQQTRYASAILILLTEIAWVALLIQASSFILSVILPIDYFYLLIATTTAFMVYTLIGGQYAVVYTDIIQFMVMTIGILFIATPLLFLKAVPYFGSIPMSHLSFPINTHIGLLSAGSIFFMMFMPHIVGPDIYSKLLSAQNTQSAQKASIGAGLLKFLFAISIGIIALAAFVIPSINSQVSTPALAIPLAIASLPPIITGFVLASFLSVMMSSADSCLLSAGTILSVDITQKHSMTISRIGIIVVGIAALALALYHTLLGGILDTLQLAYTVFTAGLSLPVLFGFYKAKTKVTSKGAKYSLILGGTSSLIWLQFAPFAEYAVLIGLIISLIPLLVFRQ
ncbi:MAG: sodium:solute symporter family protein [Thermoplasmatota archaeon]